MGYMHPYKAAHSLLKKFAKAAHPVLALLYTRKVRLSRPVSSSYLVLENGDLDDGVCHTLFKDSINHSLLIHRNRGLD
jgi:hypothetical protein